MSLYLNKFFFFIAAFCFVLISHFPKEISAQQILSVGSEDFFKEYMHLADDEETVIIDGRTHEMFSDGHLRNAINIDADEPHLIALLAEHLHRPRIVVYCTTVRRTGDIVFALQSIYSGDIIFIYDGIKGWKSNGLPLEVQSTDSDSTLNTEP